MFSTGHLVTLFQRLPQSGTITSSAWPWVMNCFSWVARLQMSGHVMEKRRLKVKRRCVYHKFLYVPVRKAVADFNIS